MNSNEGTERIYLEELQHASASDLSSVEGQGIVTVYATDDGSELLEDCDGNNVIALVPGNVPNDGESWEKSFHLFLRETAEVRHSLHKFSSLVTRLLRVVKDDYRIIYVHSGFSSPLWFTWWLFGLRNRVSRDHRKNLKALTIIHPTITVRLFFLSMRPFISAKFWEKLHYVDRIDELFLDDIIPKAHIRRLLPASVIANEQEIVEEGEVARQLAIAAGVDVNHPRN